VELRIEIDPVFLKDNRQAIQKAAGLSILKAAQIITKAVQKHRLYK
jgi:hypothetical protein